MLSDDVNVAYEIVNADFYLNLFFRFCNEFLFTDVMEIFPKQREYFLS